MMMLLQLFRRLLADFLNALLDFLSPRRRRCFG